LREGKLSFFRYKAEKRSDGVGVFPREDGPAEKQETLRYNANGGGGGEENLHSHGRDGKGSRNQLPKHVRKVKTSSALILSRTFARGK